MTYRFTGKTYYKAFRKAQRAFGMDFAIVSFSKRCMSPLGLIYRKPKIELLVELLTTAKTVKENSGCFTQIGPHPTEGRNNSTMHILTGKSYWEAYEKAQQIFGTDFTVVSSRIRSIPYGFSFRPPEVEIVVQPKKYEKIDSENNVESEKEFLPVEFIRKELTSLIGIESAKKQVTELINFVQVEKIKKERNLKTFPISLHMVFSGNPGTGKTTVARLIGKYFYKIGLCKKDVFIEVDRAGIVQKYIGHTEARVKELFEKAKGGVLFIDEAYALADKGDDRDFGQKALDTMLVLIEELREDIIVIFAGYKEKMDEFLNGNPGLKSRLPFRILFEDYTEKELFQIFCYMAKERNLSVSPECEVNFYQVLKKGRVSLGEFGNARGARNLLERIVIIQANRVVQNIKSTNEELQTIISKDFEPILNLPYTIDKKTIGFVHC